MKKRLVCGLAAGLVAVALMSGCSSKNKPLADPIGSRGLLGSRELVPPPFGKPSDLKMLPVGESKVPGTASGAIVEDLNAPVLDGEIPAEPELEIVDARLQSVVPPAAKPSPKTPAKPAGGAFVPAPSAPSGNEGTPILDLGKDGGVVTPAKPVVKQVYTVKRGDTLTRIAKLYGVTWQAIAVENKLSNGASIKVGQKLTMPADAKEVKEPAVVRTAPAKAVKNHASTRSGRSHSSTKPLPKDGKYTVKSGDSLWRIADRYGLKIKDIRRWNNLSSDMLQIDQVLILKGGTESAPATSKTTSGTKARTSRKATRSRQSVSGLSGDKHIVTRGESLWTIARDYKVKQDDLMEWNGLKSTRLQINQVLLIKAPAGDHASTSAKSPAVRTASESKQPVSEPKAAMDVVDFHANNPAVPVAAPPAPVQETVSPVPTFNAPASSKPIPFTVAPGDTLDRLLQEKGIQIDEFRRLNPNVDTDKPLVPGTELLLPF